MKNILVVNDDVDEAAQIATIITQAGFTATLASTSHDALRILFADQAISALILDLVMPELDGLGILAKIKKSGRAIPTIVLATAKASDTALTAINMGATDFCTRPLDPARLLTSLRNMLKMQALQTSLSHASNLRRGHITFANIIGSNPTFVKTITRATKAAQSNIPILFEGERGTGKSLLAHALKNKSSRANRSFHKVACDSANLAPDALIQAQTAAHRGTLYLSEIGALDTSAQQDLVRALTHQADKSSPDFRLIASTSHRLLALAKSGQFTQELYDHLNIYPVFVPPLRDRKDDIPALSAHFITSFAAEQGRSDMATCSPAALEMLGQYDWPGNIAQLQTVIYRALCLSTGPELREEDFPQLINALKGRATLRAMDHAPLPHQFASIDTNSVPERYVPAKSDDRFTDTQGTIRPLAKMEKDLIAFALEKHNGQMSKIARTLEIGRSTLYRKLKEYDLIEPALGQISQNTLKAPTPEKKGRAA